MLTEHIYDPETKELLATLLVNGSTDEGPNSTNFVTSPDCPIQLGVLTRPMGTLIEAHQHVPVTEKTGSQEILIIESGVVVVYIYDAHYKLVTSRTLRAGDIYMQYGGGHSFQFVRDTKFIEVKQGPHRQENKVYFNPLDHEQSK